MAGIQPAAARLLTEATAAATYATAAGVTGAATTAANTAVTAATAALPRGVVYTTRSGNPVNVTLTAGRLYRVTAQVAPTTNAAVTAGARVIGQAGTTAPAAGGGSAVTATALSAQTGTGTSNPTLLPTGVFNVATTGAFSFNVQGSAPQGTTAGLTTILGASEWVLEDVGATGAAGSGRVSGVTL